MKPILHSTCLPFLIMCFSAFLAGSPLASAATAVEVVPRSSAWAWWKGTNDPTSAEGWRLKSFDDAAWARGPAPFHYGEGVVGGTELADMRNNYSTVFLRRAFVIENPADIAVLNLGVSVDDGFVAWINGREVARSNVPEGPVSRTSVALVAATEPVPFDFFTVTNSSGLIERGTNVVALMGFNVSLGGSSDFYIDASLSVEIDNTPPVVLETFPAPGSKVRSLVTIEVHFNERVTGLEAGDLLINGAPCDRVVENAAGQFLFTFSKPADGLVTVAWRDGHGIADLSGAARAFTGGRWTYSLDSTLPVPGLAISEFMAENDRTLNDEDGESSDWIEIHNSGSEPVEMTGFFLTDEALNPTKWRFPAISIPSQGFLVVFASEKNRTNPASKLHTNFRLAPSGEYLALLDARTNVLSSFGPTFPSQVKDVSYGRLADSAQAGYFLKPTPGAANSAGGPGFSPEIEFSRLSSTFVNPFYLSLATGFSNAVIRFTLNGSAPALDSLVYTGPIPITNSVQVRARAFVPGLLPGPIRSEGFILLGRDVLSFTSDLPVLILHTLGQGTVNSSRQTPLQISVYEPENGITSITNKPTFYTRGALRVRGSSTEGLAKASWAMEFWDESNFDVNLPILDLPADSDWVLYAPNSFEPSLLHNPFMHSLSKAIGRYSPRTRFVEVFFSSGQATGPIASNRYHGIYVLEERISVGKDRVDIHKLEPEHLNVPEVQGGYLLKIDRLDPGDGGFSAAGQLLAYVEPKEREIELPSRAAQRRYIADYFAAFGRTLSDRTLFSDPVRGYASFIDSASWIDFHWLNTLSANPDGLRLSTYLHKPRFGPITFGPIWDFDRTLGSTDGRDANPRLWGGGGSTYFFNYTWWASLFRDVDFHQSYLDRYQALRRGEFSTPALQARVEMLASQVRQAYPRERTRWRTAPRGGSYETEIARLKTWLSNRVDFIDSQCVRPPVLSHPGGSVAPGFLLSLANPTNTPVYYTEDGSDPRLPRGLISPSAKIYQGPITVSTNTRIVARVLNPGHRPRTGGDGPLTNTPWSGPVSATFTVAPITLSVTEIMFHPANAASPGIFSADDFQFIELKNTGSSTVNLAGVSLGSDVRFQFPTNVFLLAPGAYTLLVRNRAAFASGYPAVQREQVAGEFLGTLGHAGGQLTLTGPLQEPILDFEYQDSWQLLADGFGFSLVARNEVASGLDDRSHWRLSANPGGSPGAADPEPSMVPTIWINEVMSHSDPGRRDAVELHNPNPFPVDISGWYLSDEFRRPKAYRFPAGTIVPPSGFLVTSESEWNLTGNTGFSLNSSGDDIHLFSAGANGQLTGWHHGFRFGALPPNGSFGRFIDSRGGEYLLRLGQPSPGAVNGGPMVGPVVIAQAMFHPPDAGLHNNTLHEFVMIQNWGASNVSLFHPDNPGVTWRLRGEVSFDFPASAVLPAGGSILVVSFDPIQRPGALVDLRARYRIPLSTPILGPWSGRLNNAGGSIRLQRPGSANPDDDGEVPFELVEELRYNTEPPWPSDASGSGKALLRAKADGPAIDSASWVSGVPFQTVADDDRDGLPNDWEIAFGLNPASAVGGDGPLGDGDRDGHSNESEFRAGTHPGVASSRLAMGAVRLSGDRIQFTFDSQPGRTYLVQCRDRLGDGDWITLPAGTTSISGGAVVVSDVRGGEIARYYRLIVP